MSFTYKMNKTGPRIVPWGTPDKTGDQDEQVPRRTTRCIRPVKKITKPLESTAVDTVTLKLEKKTLMRYAVKRLGKIQKGDVSWLSVVAWFCPIVVTRKKLRKRWSTLHVSELGRVNDIYVSHYSSVYIFILFLIVNTFFMLLSPGILRCTCAFDHCYGYLHNISDYCFGVVSIVKKKLCK